MCFKIGGKLPSADDYTKLTSFFDESWSTASLTPQAMIDWETLFPDMPGSFFWTSNFGVSMSWPYVFSATGFDGASLRIDSNISSGDLLAKVRCIQK